MNSSSGHPPPLPRNPEAAALLEQRAREYLAQGRFRKARDELKALCKIDRGKYLPLLIQANQGLVRDMIAKGQVSEAQPVIAYLKTIASPAEVRPLELELAGKSDLKEAYLANFAAALMDSKMMSSAAERLRLADQVILAFQPLDPHPPALAQLASEVRAIHEALQAIGHQQFDQALALLRPISHRSAFGHWKLFLKGLVAFYSNQRDRAERAC